MNFNKNKPNGFDKLVTRHTTIFEEDKQLFRISNIPVRKSTMKCISSPKGKVQIGSRKSEAKLNQLSEIISRPSSAGFLKPPGWHFQNNRLNVKRELIKKMVALTEYAMKENREIKSSTPVKPQIGLTPRETPRPKGFLLLPDLNKVDGLPNPIEGIVSVTKMRKKICKMETPNILMEDSLSRNHLEYSSPGIHSPTVSGNALSVTHEPFINVNDSKDSTKLSSMLANRKNTFSKILHHCQLYNDQVRQKYEKLQRIQDCFENNVKNIPEFEIYNEFCLYKSKKLELYKEIKALEDSLDNTIKDQLIVGDKLKNYIKASQELLKKRLNLQKSFEQAVQKALIKCEKEESLVIEEKEEKKVEENPKLRRSLRLSKILLKDTKEQKTPISKKLKKLDSKSRGISRSRRIASPRYTRHR